MIFDQSTIDAFWIYSWEWCDATTHATTDAFVFLCLRFGREPLNEEMTELIKRSYRFHPIRVEGSHGYRRWLRKTRGLGGLG